ncbi:hypothetical protein IB69_020270 [Xanthomonas citri]|nr:hypothetical protein IB69_020270 [Xanthomonas citri]
MLQRCARRYPAIGSNNHLQTDGARRQGLSEQGWRICGGLIALILQRRNERLVIGQHHAMAGDQFITDLVHSDLATARRNGWRFGRPHAGASAQGQSKTHRKQDITHTQ